MRRVDVHSRRRLLNDFFKVDEAEVSFERFDGSMTPPVRRECSGAALGGGGGVRPRRQAALLTEPISLSDARERPRLAARDHRRHDRTRRTAGGVTQARDRGRARLPCASHRTHRYLLCFSGRLFRAYLVVLCADRRCHRVSAGGGLAREQEDIRVVGISPDEASAALKDGKIADAKSLIGLQWFLARRS